MRILFVAPYVPSRIRVRALGWLRALAARGHHIHLIALRPPEDRWAPDEPLRQLCDRVDVLPLTRLRTLLNVALALPGRAPLQAAYSRHAEARRMIERRVSTGTFDVIHVEHLRASVLVDQLNSVPIVFDAVDSISALFDRAARLAPRLRQRLMARVDLGRTRRFERRALSRFDRVVVTTRAEAAAFSELGARSAGERISIVPNGVDLEYFHPHRDHAEPATILFSGKLSYHANLAAALWLAKRVMPRVWRERPDAKLVLAGKDPAPELRALGRNPRVRVTGFVEDLRPFIDRAAAVAVPMVYAGGIQNKALEAMASGVPVVATPEAAGSLQAQAGRDLLVASSAEDFAASLLGLMGDRALRDRVGVAGRAYVEAHHDWTTLAGLLVRAYDRAGETRWLT